MSLTYFEVGNSVWKTDHLLKKLTQDEAESLLELSMQLLTRLEVLSLTDRDAVKIMELAKSLKITFYDASYLFASRKNMLPLVTDDERLGKAARQESIKTLSSASAAADTTQM